MIHPPLFSYSFFCFFASKGNKKGQYKLHSCLHSSMNHLLRMWHGGDSVRGAQWDLSREVQPCIPATLRTVKIWKWWLGSVHRSPYRYSHACAQLTAGQLDPQQFPAQPQVYQPGTWAQTILHTLGGRLLLGSSCPNSCWCINNTLLQQRKLSLWADQGAFIHLLKKKNK